MTRMQVQQLYHAGARVGILAVSPEGSSIATEAGSPFALDVEYDAARQLKYAGILSPAGVVVDAFVCTNGVLVPVPNAALDAAAEMAPDVKKLMFRERKRSPEQFHQEVDRMVRKADK
ncbi:MAG TPA: hypothetical protein VL527_06285 [Dongiaceae bacterium]|nr:hypothetical protein [Dongiaceae bacterium]